MQKKRSLKILSAILSVMIIISLVAGCTEPEASGTVAPGETLLPTDVPTQTPSVPSETPSRTYSPIIVPTPTPSVKPTVKPSESPAPTPIIDPEPEDYYIYTLDRGDGLYAYAWTEECPVVSSKIAVGTKSDEVKAIQRRLTDLGFYCGTIGGTLNTKTMTAVNEFRQIAGLEVDNSYIDKATIDLLFSPDGIEAMTVEELEVDADSLKGMTVFVDAGHGGPVATGTARGSLVEKDCVLEIAYRLKDILEEAGARVYMTRTDDSEISLTYRLALANYVMLDDIVKDTEEKIKTQKAMIEGITDVLEMPVTELSENLKNIVTELSELDKRYRELIAIIKDKEENGTDDEEYRNALIEAEKIKGSIKELSDEKTFLTKTFYCKMMGVPSDLFVGSYVSYERELEEYRDKIAGYRDLFNVNLDSPEVEFEGLFEKHYDENGMRAVDKRFTEIMDITGDLCTENYVFISIHVNGVDGNTEVNGTEIYVRNGNFSNAYGNNKTFYGNYCTDARTKLAQSLVGAIGEVQPLENGKSATIKDSDFFVLREGNLPSVLIETAFSTNLHDRLKLLDPKAKYKIAYSIYKGISNYYNN